MANKKIPVRQCVGCRQMKPKRELIRVIRTAENTFCLDMTGKKNGRGAYLCPNRECLAQAIKGRGLEHSLKAAVPNEIYGEFEKEIEKLETR